MKKVNLTARPTVLLPQQGAAGRKCVGAGALVVGHVADGAAAVAVAKAFGVVFVAPTSNLARRLTVVQRDTKESSSGD